MPVKAGRHLIIFARPTGCSDREPETNCDLAVDRTVSGQKREGYSGWRALVPNWGEEVDIRPEYAAHRVEIIDLLQDF